MTTNINLINAALEGSLQSREVPQAKDAKETESTISCKSCRERKLRCDRQKPKCDTCSRLKHRCEYVERRKASRPKRRQMKDSETRIEHLETNAVHNQNAITDEAQDMDVDWGQIGEDLYIGLGLHDLAPTDSSFDASLAILGGPPAGYFPPPSDLADQQLMEMGLKEALPAQEMINELHQIYFSKFHPLLPMIHQYRYYVSLDRAPFACPAICLRYAIWAIAASLSEKYKRFEDLLYERARAYIDASEMKSDSFATIYHAQTWCLIAMYEAKTARFSRSWMSAGKAVRLVQMLGLYSLDDDAGEAKKVLPPARDWIELEERRRTFWVAFYGDRWASVLTGWPMTINESEIMTNLPSNEDSFKRGVATETITFAKALTPAGIQMISPFSYTILASALYGHNYQHLYTKGLDERVDDVSNGEFWKRYRKLDEVLMTTFMFLPEKLRLPGALQDMTISFNHMTIHAAAISLHQGAIEAANKHQVDGDIIRHSQVRCLTAAREITSIMRHISHEDPTKMNSWIGFCLYVAASVYIREQKSNQPQPQALLDLEYLMSAMRIIGHSHPISRHFLKMLERDVAAAGLDAYVDSATHVRIWRACHPTPANHNTVNSSGVSIFSQSMTTDIWPSIPLHPGGFAANISPHLSASTSNTLHEQSSILGEVDNTMPGQFPFQDHEDSFNQSTQKYPGFPPLI